MHETYHPRDPVLDGHLHRAKALRGELQLLKRHYSIVTPARFLDWIEGNCDLPKHAVLLTCDDGLLSSATDMLPILQEEQLPCLFFVTCDSLNNELRMLWHEELYLAIMDGSARELELCLDSVPCKFSIRTKEEKLAVYQRLVREFSKVCAEERSNMIAHVRVELGLDDDWKAGYLADPVLQRRFALLTISHLWQLVQAGMTIGAHTLTHSYLAQQSPEMARAELSQSRRALQDALGLPVWALAYPFGGPDSVGEREFQMAESAGYQCAFLSCGGALREDSCRFALPRIHIPGDMKLASFEAHASGFHSAFRTMISG